MTTNADLELADLSTVLASHGVPDGGAGALRCARMAGPDWYADRIASDGSAWSRFRRAFDALRTGDMGAEFPSDVVTIGALAWLYLLGATFMDAVVSRLAPLAWRAA